MEMYYNEVPVHHGVKMAMVRSGRSGAKIYVKCTATVYVTVMKCKE